MGKMSPFGGSPAGRQSDNVKFKIRRQLRRLKQQILLPRVVARRELLDSWRRKYYRGAFRYVALAAAVLLILSAVPTLDRGQNARKQILGAATASGSFSGARAAVEAAAGMLTPLLVALPPGRDLDQVLSAGEHAEAALPGLGAIANSFDQANFALEEPALYFQLRDNAPVLAQSRKEVGAALAALTALNAQAIPAEYRQKLEEAKHALLAAATFLDLWNGIADIFLPVLGGADKTYLLIFQNNAEARPTGGFIGTYGLLRFYNGAARIEKIESIYVLDGQLRRQITPPGPMLKFLTDRWGIRDSNWFADFSSSARKMLEFLREEAAVKADGVISFTPDVFEALLRLTGPIPMPEYGVTLTAENFRSVSQEQTSELYDRRRNEPKKFLADFAPRLLRKFEELNNTQRLQLFEILLAAADKKQLLMFSSDPGVQGALRRQGVAGEVRRVDYDYLNIVHSNLGGGKTDLDMRQSVKKTVAVAADGTAVVDLAITREHRGFEERELPVNRDFLRVLVPPGSRLIQAEGFDNEPHQQYGAIGETDPDIAEWESGRESGYAYFAGWIILSPGERRTIHLRYELPFKVDRKYSQLLQTQPGARPFDFALQILPRPEWREVFSHPAQFQGSIASDQFYGKVWQ